MEQKLISPSLLSADFANLERDVKMLNESSADFIHLDIMEGVFFPNKSFGMPVVEAVSRHSEKPLDVHLMIVEPERYTEQFARLGANVITIHQEATRHLHRAVQQIKARKVKAGVSINPATPVSSLEDIIADIDLVLVMSVNPGFGGQAFIDNTYKKLARLREMIELSGSKALIEVDGGVNDRNAAALFDAGADILVAGNYVFKSPDPKAAIDLLKGQG